MSTHGIMMDAGDAAALANPAGMVGPMAIPAAGQ